MEIVFGTQVEITSAGNKIYYQFFDGVGEIVWTNDVLERGFNYFSSNEYEQIAQEILGVESMAQLDLIVNETFLPYRGSVLPEESIMMHCSSSTIGDLEVDREKLISGEKPAGGDPQVTHWATKMTGPKGVFVGRGDDTKALMDVKGFKDFRNNDGANSISVVDMEATYYYYGMDQYLATALDNPNHEGLQYLITKIKENPNIPIRIFTLDPAAKIFLTWLKNQAGVDQLVVDCNSPEISATWNQKGILYPTVEQAQELDLKEYQLDSVYLEGIKIENYSQLVEILNSKNKTLVDALTDNLFDEVSLSEIKAVAYSILDAEGRMSFLGEVVGDIQGMRTPGYSIEYEDGIEFEAYFEKFQQAALLLRNRYGLTKVCSKIFRSSDGFGVQPNLNSDLSENEEGSSLYEHAFELWKRKSGGIVEAHTFYKQVTVNGYTKDLVPSSHIIAGKATGIVSQQLVGTGKYGEAKGSWKGNIMIKKDDFSDKSQVMGINLRQFEIMNTFMERFENGSKKMGKPITDAGFDFGIAEIGGIFGMDEFISPQDPNIRFTGAFPMYAAEQIFRNRLNTNGHLRIATHIICPPEAVSLKDIQQYISENGLDNDLEFMGFTKNWLMLASPGFSPEEALDKVLKYSEQILNLKV